MKKILLILISTFILSVSSASAKIKVGALYLDTAGFFGEIKVGIEAAGAAEGIDLTGANSQSDVAKESEFIDNLIATGVEVVIRSPVSTDSSVAAVERLAEAGIPVVCYNTCLNDEDAKRLAYALVTTSQRELGYPVGVIAGNWAIKAGIDLKIGIHNCNRYEACQEREDGFLDGIKSTGASFEVVNNQEAFANDKATQVGTDMLIANPEINLMYAANEGGTIGAVNAVLASGQVGKTYVMGTDATEELMNFVADGEILLALNSQFPREMGAGAMNAALKAIKGEKIGEYVQLTPTKVFTTVDRLAIDKWISER